MPGLARFLHVALSEVGPEDGQGLSTPQARLCGYEWLANAGKKRFDAAFASHCLTMSLVVNGGVKEALP